LRGFVPARGAHAAAVVGAAVVGAAVVDVKAVVVGGFVVDGTTVLVVGAVVGADADVVVITVVVVVAAADVDDDEVPELHATTSTIALLRMIGVVLTTQYVLRYRFAGRVLRPLLPRRNAHSNPTRPLRARKRPARLRRLIAGIGGVP
jgi:hypothetical protein